MSEFPNLIKAGLKVGDEVDTVFGDGIVTSIEHDAPYRIRVSVEGDILIFTATGKHINNDKYPLLWLKSDMSWFTPPTKPPEPDHMKEFTLGRKVWVRERCVAWIPRIAAVYLPSAKRKFCTFANVAGQETANTIAIWDEVSYTKPEGAKDHEQ